MKSLWSHLGSLFIRQREAEGSLNAGLMLAGAVRAMLFQKKHRELLRLEIIRKYIVDAKDPDVLFHLSHRYYLANTFNQRERIDCALTHYRYESAQYDSRYKDAVYRDGGVTLWSRRVGTVSYTIRLATADLRHEGDLSVRLLADNTSLSEMSFSWVGAEVLGLDSGTILFITRNQSVQHDFPAWLRFREDFPQNSPPYFCLAALHGVAAANGSNQIAAIRHERQVAFEERYATGFRNSYCEFWKSFGAVATGRVAYVMPVPLASPPIAEVKAKHRKRALDRRRHWSEICNQSRLSLLPHLPPVHTDQSRFDRRALATVVVHVHAVAALLLVGLG